MSASLVDLMREAHGLHSPEPAAMGISSPIPAGPSSREEVLVYVNVLFDRNYQT